MSNIEFKEYSIHYHPDTFGCKKNITIIFSGFAGLTLLVVGILTLQNVFNIMPMSVGYALTPIGSVILFIDCTFFAILVYKQISTKKRMKKMAGRMFNRNLFSAMEVKNVAVLQDKWQLQQRTADNELMMQWTQDRTLHKPVYVTLRQWGDKTSELHLFRTESAQRAYYTKHQILSIKEKTDFVKDLISEKNGDVHAYDKFPDIKELLDAEELTTLMESKKN